MKLISFMNNGAPTYGIVSGADNASVLDLKPILGDRAPDLRSLIAQKMTGAAAAALAQHGAPLKFASLELLPVIPNPDKILCVGLNYKDHLAESGRASTELPAIFLRVRNTGARRHRRSRAHRPGRQLHGADQPERAPVRRRQARRRRRHRAARLERHSRQRPLTRAQTQRAIAAGLPDAD